MIDVTKLTKQSFARQVGIVAKMKGAIEQMTKEKPGCRLTEWAFLLNNELHPMLDLVHTSRPYPLAKDRDTRYLN